MFSLFALSEFFRFCPIRLTWRQLTPRLLATCPHTGQIGTFLKLRFYLHRVILRKQRVYLVADFLLYFLRPCTT